MLIEKHFFQKKNCFLFAKKKLVLVKGKFFSNKWIFLFFASLLSQWVLFSCLQELFFFAKVFFFCMFVFVFFCKGLSFFFLSKEFDLFFARRGFFFLKKNFSASFLFEMFFFCGVSGRLFFSKGSFCF